MTMDLTKKSVASRIANAECSTGASNVNSADFSAPDPVSANSSLSTLEAAMKATKISTRSCLKSAQQSPNGNAKPTKRASFVSDEDLLKCMVTGAHILPKVQTKERHEEFFQRSCEVAQQREEAEEADSDDDANNTYLLYAAREENRDDDDSDSARFEANLLEQRLDDAQRASQTLTMRAITSGAIDFALYVMRNEESLENLEKTARAYSMVAKVESYQDDERSHVHGRDHSITWLAPECYENFHTAMSSVRTPQAFLNMPVSHWENGEGAAGDY